MYSLSARLRRRARWRRAQVRRLAALGTRVAPALPLLLLFVLFFFQLGARDLVSSHEARAAQNAQRMLDTGEWGLPTLFDGQPDLQKPPGYYWLVAVTGWLNGGQVTPWVARFPAAVCALLSVLLVYAFLRREGYRTAAIVAACVLATANHFVAIGRTARIDVPLTCAVAVALVSFYRGCTAGFRGARVSRPRHAPSPGPEHEIPQRHAPPTGGRRDTRPPRGIPWFLLSALAAGFAVLLKGPVALALIGPVAVLWLLWERAVTPDGGPRLPVRSAVLGVLVVGAVAAPWFVWVNHTTGGAFGRVFFWHHNVERFAGSSESLATHPWWYYIPRFALAFLPWTLPLNCLAIWALRTGVWRESPLFRFGTVWFVGMIAILSFAQFKRADYLLPAFPGAAITLGCAAERWLATRRTQRSLVGARWGFGLLLAGGLAVWPVMWYGVEPAEAAKHEKKPFALAIRAHAPGPQPVILFRTEAHLLTFHLEPPVHTLVEWGELRAALSNPGPHVIVMPPEYAAEAERFTNRKLVIVADLADYTAVRPPRPLVCFRTAD